MAIHYLFFANIPRTEKHRLVLSIEPRCGKLTPDESALDWRYGGKVLAPADAAAAGLMDHGVRAWLCRN